MNPRHAISRRFVLQTGAAAVGLLVVGCKGKASEPPTCTDVTGLTPDEVTARNSLAYQDRAPDQNKSCSKCVQYVNPPSEGACGGCKVLKGGVSPAGTCKVFAPRT